MLGGYSVWLVLCVAFEFEDLVLCVVALRWLVGFVLLCFGGLWFITQVVMT